MENTLQQFDVIISGGGLSGALMALSIADITKADGSLLSIAMVEANQIDLHVNRSSSSSSSSSSQNSQNKPNAANASNRKTSEHRPVFDDRVLALSHGSAAYLNDINVWQHVKDSACAIDKIDISDRGNYGKARVQAQDHNVLALGYVIEMAHLGTAFLQELATKRNVHWYCPDSISAIDWQPLLSKQPSLKSTKHITITLNSGTELATALLLGCDGAKSPCRQLAGIKSSHSDYQQVAIIANVATANDHQHKAFERFTEFGPLAMLPLTPLNGQSRCSLVWTLTPAQGQQMLALSDDDFCQQLEIAFGSWLGKITQVGKRDLFPLWLVQAQQQTYHRMALIGNASHTIHPIAGQGFNLGLRDISLMAQLIKKQLATADADLGSFALLTNYAQQRQQDQQHVIKLTDSLVTLFANDLPPLVMGRNIGLKVMNYCSPIKRGLVNRLMGY